MQSMITYMEFQKFMWCTADIFNLQLLELLVPVQVVIYIVQCVDRQTY